MCSKDVDRIKREAFDEGRAAAAACFPMVHDEGAQEGYDAAMNGIFRRLRERARTDPMARSFLAELLNG